MPFPARFTVSLNDRVSALPVASAALYIAAYFFLAAALVAAVAFSVIAPLQAASLLLLSAALGLAFRKLAARDPVGIFWSCSFASVAAVLAASSFGLLANAYAAAAVLLAGFGASALAAHFASRPKGS
jgi:hypothetical protein